MDCSQGLRPVFLILLLQCYLDETEGKRMIRTATTVPALTNGTGGSKQFLSIVRTVSALHQRSATDCRYGENCTTTFPALEGHERDRSKDENETVFHQILQLFNPNLLCLDYKGPSPISLKRYNPETQICCDGLYNRTKPTEECCNGNLIDTEEEICCNDQHTAVNGTIGCCDNRLYDKNDTICCNGTLAPKTKYSVCCGDRVISEITEICCDGRAHVKDIFPGACCGTSLYNTVKEICCGGVVRPKLGPNGHYGQCCGTSSYNPRCFTCSNDLRLQPKDNTTTNGTCCLGRIVLNGGVKLCCENGSDVKDCRHIVVIEEHISGEGKTIAIIIISCTVSFFMVTCLVSSIICRRFIRKLKNPKIESGESGSRDDKYQLLGETNGNNESNILEPSNSTAVRRMSRGSSMASSRLNVFLPRDDEFDQNFQDNYVNDDVGFMLNFREVNDVINVISKPKTHKYSVNQIEDHFKDIACQTIHKENTCNRRTIFGRTFTNSCILDTKQPIFKMEHSEVYVQLPFSSLKDPIEMHGSSFDNIPSICEKIDIPDGEAISSPVVEYLLTGDVTLDDYAIVTMPYLGTRDQITVLKFMSDDGMQTRVKPVEVPLKTKENTIDPVFYLIEGNRVRIYTKSFSGFFVTTRRHNRESHLNLRAFLFGSHKKINGYHEARLALYIADEIMTFMDYKKTMYGKEADEGKKIIKEQILHLTDQVREDDILKASLIMYEEEAQTWKHQLHPGTGRPMYPVTSEIRFEEIVQKCPDCEGCHFRQKTVPYCIEWYLRTPAIGPAYPTDVFKCFVDVDCVKLDTNESKNNVILVDELHLRPQDRYPYMESDETNRISRLKRFLIGLDAEAQVKFIEKMNERHHCSGSEIYHTFDDLQRKMKTVGMYEAVIDVLQAGQMYQHLDALQKTGILESKYFPKPTQRVGMDHEECHPLPSSSEECHPLPNSSEECHPLPSRSEEAQLGPNTIAQPDQTADTKSDTSSTHNKAMNSDLPSVAGDSTCCRNELGSDLPVCSYEQDQTFDRNGLVGFHERPVESQATTVEMTSSTHVKQTDPVQEEAQGEETCLKSMCSTDSESEN